MATSEQNGPGKGVGAALTRVYHQAMNSSTAMKWNIIELFTQHKTFGPDKIPKRSEDVVVITGGARGIGADAVKKLLQADMTVFIGCRKPEEGTALIAKIRSAGVTTGKAEASHLDLKSLASVRRFGQEVLAKNLPINILINNAGIMWTPYEVTGDGFEAQFQVNYLSHFLLTNMLLPRIANSGRDGVFSRIINVSSIAQYGGNVQFENLDMKKNFSTAKAYQTSKLAQVISSNFLDAKFKSHKIKVQSFAVHPGIIESDLYNTLFGFSTFRAVFRKMWKSSEQGADGIVFAALSGELEGKGGLLLGNSQEMPQVEQALNKELQQKLWDVSCELVDIDKNQLNNQLASAFKQ